MKIKHLVQKSIKTTRLSAGINSVAKRLRDQLFLVVIDKGSFSGVLTPSDIIKSRHKRVIDCLHERPCISCEQDIASVLMVMKQCRKSVLPVFDGDAFIGVVTQEAISDYLFEYRNELKRVISERTADLIQANERLKRETEERQHYLSSQLIRAQENERKRIARELHDCIGQSLSAVKFGLHNALTMAAHNAGSVSVESLEALDFMIQQAIEEIRRLQTELRPFLLDELGIATTVSWFCREFEKLYSGIRLEKQITIDDADAPRHLRLVIFRILQEALNNVSKHANANLVRVSLTKTGGKIELAVEDNGVGFDVEHVWSLKDPKRGLGLTSMKERTELSAGSFSIQSNKGAGTIVRASWQC